jgi:hypothetical protein
MPAGARTKRSGDYQTTIQGIRSDQGMIHFCAIVPLHVQIWSWGTSGCARARVVKALTGLRRQKVVNPRLARPAAQLWPGGSSSCQIPFAPAPRTNTRMLPLWSCTAAGTPVLLLAPPS